MSTELAKRVQALIDDENDSHKRDPHWEISVWVPDGAGDEFHERMFMAISDVVHEMEDAEKARDWDVFVMSSKGHPCIPVHVLASALESRDETAP